VPESDHRFVEAIPEDINLQPVGLDVFFQLGMVAGAADGEIGKESRPPSGRSDGRLPPVSVSLAHRAMANLSQTQEVGVANLSAIELNSGGSTSPTQQRSAGESGNVTLFKKRRSQANANATVNAVAAKISSQVAEEIVGADARGETVGPLSVVEGDVAAMDQLLMPQLPVLAKPSINDLAKLSFGSDASPDPRSTVRSTTGAGKEGIASAADVAELGAGLGHQTNNTFGQLGVGSTLTVLLGIFVVIFLSCFCLVAGCSLATVIQHDGVGGGDLASAVHALPRCPASEVDTRLPQSGGYDCTFSKPISSKEVLRLEVTVVEPASPLKAPLTGRPCVLYSAAVSRRLHDGVHPVPVAFHSSSTAFSVVLTDAPHMRVEISGEDVSLFAMASGRHTAQHKFGRAPDHWQDFVRMHRAVAPLGDPHTSLATFAAPAQLDFQECALLVGATATVVGELHRGADGTLSLRPLQGGCAGPGARAGAGGAGGGRGAQGYATDVAEVRVGLMPDSIPTANCEAWRTSWERASCDGRGHAKAALDSGAVSLDPQLWSSDAAFLEQDLGAFPQEILAGRVYVSDDPVLRSRERSWGCLHRVQDLNKVFARARAGLKL